MILANVVTAMSEISKNDERNDCDWRKYSKTANAVTAIGENIQKQQTQSQQQ